METTGRYSLFYYIIRLKTDFFPCIMFDAFVSCRAAHPSWEPDLLY